MTALRNNIVDGVTAAKAARSELEAKAAKSAKSAESAASRDAAAVRGAPIEPFVEVSEEMEAVAAYMFHPKHRTHRHEMLIANYGCHIFGNRDNLFLAAKTGCVYMRYRTSPNEFRRAAVGTPEFARLCGAPWSAPSLEAAVDRYGTLYPDRPTAGSPHSPDLAQEPPVEMHPALTNALYCIAEAKRRGVVELADLETRSTLVATVSEMDEKRAASARLIDTDHSVGLAVAKPGRLNAADARRLLMFGAASEYVERLFYSLDHRTMPCTLLVFTYVRLFHLLLSMPVIDVITIATDDDDEEDDSGGSGDDEKTELRRQSPAAKTYRLPISGMEVAINNDQVRIIRAIGARYAFCWMMFVPEISVHMFGHLDLENPSAVPMATMC